MSDRIKSINDNLSAHHNDNLKRKDLDLILEVNRKAIELETEAVEQNEEIIDLLNKSKDTLIKSNDKIADALCEYNEKIDLVDKKVDKKLDAIIEQNEKLSRDIFTIKILFATGLISLIVQIIQIFIKK